MGDAGIKSAIQGSNVPNPDEAVPSFVSGAMAKAGKGLLEGTLQAGTSAVSDKLLDLVGFFFQAEDGIRDGTVTGVQTCALPISVTSAARVRPSSTTIARTKIRSLMPSYPFGSCAGSGVMSTRAAPARRAASADCVDKIGRASCRERV